MSNHSNKPKQIIRRGDVGFKTFDSLSNATMAFMDLASIFADNSIPQSHNPFIEIKNVIFNDPATIVFWTDGSKTVVRANGENFDPEKGLAMAIAKKAFGNKGNYFEHIKTWVEKYRGD